MSGRRRCAFPHPSKALRLECFYDYKPIRSEDFLFQELFLADSSTRQWKCECYSFSISYHISTPFTSGLVCVFGKLKTRPIPKTRTVLLQAVMQHLKKTSLPHYE